MHTTSSRPIPTRRHNPCQICGDIKGKCREAGDLLLCMNIRNAYSAPSEFKFLGLTKNSLWGKFVVGNRQEISFEERSERRRQREATKKAEQEARAKTALSLSERDQATRTLHKHLGLSTKHRQELRNRGLSDATIDAGYFFSVAPGDALPFGIPANYPGAKNGKLSVAGTGFVCPAWSVSNGIIGWQLRLDDATDNKYRWAKGNVSSHLTNGELPLTVIQPSELKHQWVADIEGILKPYIAAQKLGAVCVGAAGGNITASPEQFKQAIASLGVTEIRDFPDAGDVRNAQVMHRRIAKYEFYRSLGLEIKIGWWDQITKDQDDIDELATLDSIEYISVDEFLVIARQHGFNFPVQQTVQRRDEPDAKAYDEYLKREAELEQFEAGLDHYLNGKALENFLSKTLKQVKKFISQAPKYLGVSGFGEAPVLQPNTEGIIHFKAGDREKTISKLALQAKKDRRRLTILDASETGVGKSYSWGEMSNAVLGIDKLFYTSLGHRNPTVSTVESNSVELPVRNNGLFEDGSKQTSLGNNHIRWAKTNEGEKPNVTGNCSRTQEFHVWGSKGYHAETSAAASINPICGKCEFALGCAGVKDENGNLIMQPAPGNTYRSDRQEALANSKIRCSLDSLPEIASLQKGDEQKGNSPQRVGIIVDEFHQQFRATNLTQVELTEFDNTWAYFETRHLALQQEIQEIKSLVQQKRDNLETLEDKEQIKASAEDIISLMKDLNTTQQLIQRLPGVLEVVRPIVHTLRLVVAGDLPTTQQTFYGWNENLLREEIGILPEGLTEAIEVLSALNPKLSSLLDGTEADSVLQKRMEGTAKQKKESSAALRYIRNVFNRESKQQARERLKTLPANWVVPVLRILNGDHGSFRVKSGTLEVVTPNHRHKEQLLAADLSVVLDATLTCEELAENLEIDPSEIIVIQQERQSYDNLTVVQVRGLGKLTKTRSDKLNTRLNAL